MTPIQRFAAWLAAVTLVPPGKAGDGFEPFIRPQGVADRGWGELHKGGGVQAIGKPLPLQPRNPHTHCHLSRTSFASTLARRSLTLIKPIAAAPSQGRCLPPITHPAAPTAA